MAWRTPSCDRGVRIAVYRPTVQLMYMGGGDVQKAHGQLLKELNEERIAALTRISRTLEALLDQLGQSRVRIELLETAARDAETNRYRDLRERAKKYRWYLEVQREALGIRHHGILDEMYRIPGPL